MSVEIREATPEDIPGIYALIRELAEYERALDQVENTPERLLADGFGEQALYHCFVAVDREVAAPDDRRAAAAGDERAAATATTAGIIGIALVYFRYSTWKGRCLYLEDLIVTGSRRGEGLGKRLMDRCRDYARETGSRLMIWQVLDWNSSAIEFYKTLGAELQPEWVNCVLPIESTPTGPAPAGPAATPSLKRKT